MYDMEFKKIAKYLYEGVYIVDRTRKIVFWNQGAEQITGYKSEDVINSHCYQDILKHVDKNGKKLCHDGCPLLDTIQTGKANEADVYLHHKNGHRVPVSVKSMPLYDPNGNIVAAVEVFTDARYRMDHYEENRQLKEQVIKDPLTNIFNRRYLDFYLHNIKEEAKEFKTTFGVLFFDIDHFKHINDTYGHHIGDEILKMISSTIHSNIRSEDIVGRWGGEEFIAIVKNVEPVELEIIAEKLRILCEASAYQLSENQKIAVTVSIGGSVYQMNESIEEVIKRADSLMYQAKENGRNQVKIK